MEKYPQNISVLFTEHPLFNTSRVSGRDTFRFHAWLDYED